tara:strand:+ start:96 stop:734 length:639 start_codon:yes stop_codon:yes gene_type:complete
MVAFFDIETTGLDATADFVCAVVEVGGEILTFDTLGATVTWLVETKETLVTWNGLAFDFKFLADRVDDPLTRGRLAWLAMNRHMDLMLDFLADHGYPTSMQSVATPLGLSKTWTGEEAAKSTDYAAVLAYCVDDVKVLKQIYEKGSDAKWLARLTKMGKMAMWILPNTGFRPAKECLAAARACPPDQSWMTTPIDIFGTAAWATDSVLQLLE